MRSNCALSFACWKTCFCLLSRVQNSHGVQLIPVVVEVGGSLSISFSSPKLNSRITGPVGTWLSMWKCC